MRNFNGNVDFYEYGYLPVSFPEGDICCGWCRFCRTEYLADKHKRFWCTVKNEIIYTDPCEVTAEFCPLKFEK